MNASEREAYYEALVEGVTTGDLTWGQVVRGLRVDVAGVNQATFATMTKLSVRTLRKLETDDGNPTVATLTAVLRLFGLELGLHRKNRS